MHLFTTEDAEDTEVNLVHAGAEMNESFLSTIKLKKYKNICHLQPNACNTLVDKQL
jgi:hypothetical protein